MLNRSHEYQRMAEVEEKLWWYRALHSLVLKALKKYRPSEDVLIVDAGCGTGGLLMFLRASGYSRLLGFDLSLDGVEVCRQRGLQVEQDSLLNIGGRYPHSSADAIVSNDTLYFLSADERIYFVEQCRGVLKPGGILVLNVPALNAFRGIHDISVGIGYRFSRRDIAHLFGGGGFDVLKQVYWPFFLSPAVFVVRLRQRRKLKADPEAEVRSDIDLPPASINRMLAWMTGLENRCLPWKPFGSSLFIVARKAGQ